MTAATPGREELLALADRMDDHSAAAKATSRSPPLDTTPAGWLQASQDFADSAVALRLAAKPANEGLYLVWSNQHRAWWRPNSAGYTDDVKRAGRYSRAEAISISFRGRDGWDSPKGVPDELAIAERDVPVFTASDSTTGEPKR